MNPDSQQSKKFKVMPGGGTRPQTRGSILHRLSTDPFLDWMFILLVTTALLATLVVVGVYVYLGTGMTLSSSLSASGKNPLELPLDKQAMTKVLGEFDRRAAEREALGKSYRAPDDPSI